MRKPAELRDHLTTNIPSLAQNPENLHVFIEKGAIATKRGASNSFEYHYTLELLFEDYTDPADTIIVPLLVWIATHQPDLLDDTNKRDKAIGFQAELISHDTADIVVRLELTERVIVSATPGGWSCEHLSEPALPDLGGPKNWEIYLKGVLLNNATPA